MKGLAEAKASDFVFSGQRRGKPLSNMAMLVLLRRMERSDLTVHGFRSTFSVYIRERTDFPSDLAEMCLAHLTGNAVTRAYMRSDLLDKRRPVMDAWASFVVGA